MKYRVSKLDGYLLDAAVAKTLGIPLVNVGTSHQSPVDWPTDAHGEPHPWSPGKDWAVGGPIKEREKIATWWDGEKWCATHPNSKGDGGFYPCIPSSGGTAIDMDVGCGMQGGTELVSAMRAYVESKFGSEMEL